ncbi:uncharacterized protein LOC129238909 [Anastrepha obliqua]|uniref:uncharacterized protein LOC129238909 n=1 Tax=Anastrepha obliqua TaxID=95512 RepID=UPI002409E7FD|nr:uncharacterized protein LOC129238909 [Anastrepha obliqua]
MFSVENDSDMVLCPYNKAHQLLRRRLQSHLIKCRQNYPQLELQKCPFNATHHIPEPEFVLHVTNCPDRKLITQYKYNTVEVKEEEPVRHAPIECEENWDDTEVDDYNPQKYIDQKNVLQRPLGAPPAQRKAFIKRERKRLGDEESYTDSDEDEEVVKIEVSAEEDETEAKTETLIHKISPSSPSQNQEKYVPKSRSRSRSPIASAYYRRVHGRDSQSPPRPPPFRPHSSRERSPVFNNKRSAAYEIDDDPYYNSSSGSFNRNGVHNSSEDNRRSQYEAELYMQDEHRSPPLVAYPTRTPSYGRGANRGYPHNRRNNSRFSDIRH